MTKGLKWGWHENYNTKKKKLTQWSVVRCDWNKYFPFVLLSTLAPGKDKIFDKTHFEDIERMSLEDSCNSIDLWWQFPAFRHLSKSHLNCFVSFRYENWDRKKLPQFELKIFGTFFFVFYLFIEFCTWLKCIRMIPELRIIVWRVGGATASGASYDILIYFWKMQNMNFHVSGYFRYPE